MNIQEAFFCKHFAESIYFKTGESYAQGDIVGFSKVKKEVVIGLNFFNGCIRVQQSVEDCFYIDSNHYFFYKIPIKEIKIYNNILLWKRKK